MLILSGMGWGNIPDFLAEKEIASGELIQLAFPNFVGSESLTYHAIAADDKVFGPVATYLWQALSESRLS